MQNVDNSYTYEGKCIFYGNTRNSLPILFFSVDSTRQWRRTRCHVMQVLHCKGKQEGGNKGVGRGTVGHSALMCFLRG